ncbi:serine protease family [Phytophthora cinnamomi]|uniref:serine protease family n=1 Tax=Phytophthora cinnamomi TaxID=4785 RepID=UPI003559762E|nr:serine protease family [Phytophthora cinnamomi]
MSNRSEDEWSLVSDEEVLSDMSYDEVDPEPEVVEEIETEAAERKQEIPLTSVETTETAVNTDETEDVLSLLAGTSISKCSTAGYSREIRVSLLSPSHQEWFDGPPPRYSLTPSPRKKSTYVAFSGPAVRHRSFPDRLRALTAATRPVPGDVTPPTFTEVTAFKQDQSTQVNLDTAIPDRSRPRQALLRSALERSMVMANQLRSKSQDNERLSFRIAELESVAIQTEQKAQRKVIKLKLQERSMALAKQQTKLTADYHDNLKAIAEDLRRENARLEAQNAALRGEDEALMLRSLDDLEQLETALACGMDRIRAAIRAKYTAAMEKRSEQDLCVVCFVKPISVVLLPCRHQVLCATCALRVTSCPIDRKDIQDKVLTYGLRAYSDSES